MTSLFSELFVADLRALSVDLRLRVIRIVHAIERNPRPDGIVKCEPPPGSMLRPGTVVAALDGFAIRYVIESGGIRFIRCQRLLDLGIEE
jgi:hypothetical protein